MRAYIIFKINYVTLWEAVKLILLVVLFSSLVYYVTKVYYIYALGPAAVYLMEAYSVLSKPTSNGYLELPIWRDGIYLFFYNISFLEFVHYFKNKCYYYEKNSWHLCIEDPNFCKDSLCLCLFRFKNLDIVVNQIIASSNVNIDGNTYFVGKCCYEYPYSLVFFNTGLYLSSKSVYFFLPPSILNVSILLELLSYSCNNYVDYIDRSNEVCRKVYGKECFSVTYTNNIKINNLIKIYSKELSNFIDNFYKVTLNTLSRKMKSVILSTGILSDNIFCINLNSAYFVRYRLTLVPILKEIGCYKNNMYSYPLLVGIYAKDNIFYLESEGLLEKVRGFLGFKKERHFSYLGVYLDNLLLGNKLFMFFDIQNAIE